MSGVSRGYSKLDLVKEIVWTLITTAAAYLYAVAMLLAVTLVFNSSINLSFQAILLISGFFAGGMFVFNIIKSVKKHSAA